MALFEWKNGTKVQNAVVTSDGTTVQDAVWEGETPISANNMNQAQKKMQDEYNALIGELQPNSITGYLDSQLSYTSDKTAKKIPLKLNNVKGAKLSITEDGGIKIGAGVDKVLVNAQIYFYTGSNHADGKHVMVYKNDTAIGRGSRRDNYNYIFIPAGPFLIDVVEDDVIYLYCENDVIGSTVIGNGVMNTFMNVMVM